MAFKRPRATFEADDAARTSCPFVLYGSPLDAFEAGTRDDGSFVPIWKQEVVDERGRKRLHGAFTGGFSAGYFNTVGSKEGWTPSTFKSSRGDQKGGAAKVQQRPEDFMDEEDLAEQAEAQSLHINDEFGGPKEAGADAGENVFRADKDTMGLKLLRKMGWRDGQGIGPRVLRKARLRDDDVAPRPDEGDDAEEALFAPENARMVVQARKDSRLGLGFEGSREAKSETKSGHSLSGVREAMDTPFLPPTHRHPAAKSTLPKLLGSGDDDDDGDDPYEIGPRIPFYSANKIKEKPKKKLATIESRVTSANANPLLKKRPVFAPKRSIPSRLLKCSDGSLPLKGFILSAPLDARSSSLGDDTLSHQVPAGWVSARRAALAEPGQSRPQTATKEEVKPVQLTSRSRGAMLGEAQLPGKSVFDLLSPAARDRLAAATGKKDLPSSSLTATTAMVAMAAAATGHQADMRETSIPHLDAAVAQAALARGSDGWTPYPADASKDQRYREFLEFAAGVRGELPSAPARGVSEARRGELREFAATAEIFKPARGAIASRFQSSAKPYIGSGGDGADTAVAPPPAKVASPDEEAARLGMFGALTRAVLPFQPSALLCKRFNVPVPRPMVVEGAAATPHASTLVPDVPSTTAARPGATSTKHGGGAVVAETSLQDGRRQGLPAMMGDPGSASNTATAAAVEIDPERNAALEGARAGMDLFRAIFEGDDD